MPAIALITWPFIAAAIFFALGPGRGMIWTLLIGFLFLPEEYGFDLPAVPAYEKYSVISLSLILGILLTRNQEIRALEIVGPKVRTLMTLMIVAMFAGIAITVFDNTQPLIRGGGRFQPGHGIRELINFISDAVIMMLPFFLARRWLADPELQREFLRAIVILALLYSFLVLFERRMSPQLNFWLYGLRMDAWTQHLRGGGFRPMVFLNHGLVVGYYYLFAVLAAVGLARGSSGNARLLYGLAAFWLFLVLALSRNTGALFLAVLFVPVLAMFSRRGLLWTMTGVVALFMLYPAAQQSHLIPNDALVDLIETRVSPERAESIQYRFDNEVGLLARAYEKPIFGWGGWGRSRVIEEDGRDLTVTDGIWIIRMGQFGWFGYITYFGLLTLPLLFLWRRKEIPIVTLTLGIMTSANLVYLLPNSTLDVLAWMVAGATLGYLQYAPNSAENAEKVISTLAADPMSRQTSYSRFPAPSETANAPMTYRRKLTR